MTAAEAGSWAEAREKALIKAESALLARGLSTGGAFITEESTFVTAHARELEVAMRLFDQGYATPVLAGINVQGCNFPIKLTTRGLRRALAEVDHWTLLGLPPERRAYLASLSEAEGA